MTDHPAHPEVSPHAAAELATGSTEHSAPVSSIADAGVPPKCGKHNVVMDVQCDCHVCHGEGMVEHVDDYGPVPRMETCWSCRGSGISPWPDCWLCIEEYENEL